MSWGLMAALASLGLLMLAAVGPRLIGHQHFIVFGGSMEPAIPVGSVVVTERTAPTNLETGDVITYVNRADELLTHRVIEIQQDQLGLMFRTRGDVNGTDDPELVRAVNVLGRVRYSVPFAGYILHYGGQQSARLALMGLAVFVVITQIYPGWSLKVEAEGEGQRTSEALARGPALQKPVSWLRREPGEAGAAAERLAEILARWGTAR